MEDHRLQQGIAEITEQAYARRYGADIESRQRWWQIRTKAIIMIILCIIVGSLILYWFVSTILENRRGSRNQNFAESDTLKRLRSKRLSNLVLPVEYTLKIFPVLEEGNFTAIGDIQIKIYSKVSIKHIRLHAHELEIQEITINELHSSNTSKILSKYVMFDEDFLDVFFLQLLISGQIYVLNIKYTLQLNEDPVGLFRSSYFNHEINRTRWIAASNFSPDYARRAFPCFDEPWIKVPFRISIGRSSEMISHSNSMRKVTEEMQNMPGYVWDHYEKTLPISTYLVAFMVTDFSSYNVATVDRPLHRVFARENVLEHTKYIGDLMPKLLRSIENLTGFYYELDKLDVIALPCLVYSAMENWGLITFREDCILIRNSDHEEYKESLASIAAHEVAHQWFGNLVTPKWWDIVWLKEGFSSFIGNLALSTVEPSWLLEDMFIFEFRYILESSASENAHPLRINLNTIKRLDSVFDDTSYVKGNCLVYMIFHFLGKTTFLSSIRRYMHTYYYGSADQEDVWNAFQAEIDKQKSLPGELSMKDIMKAWTDQAGFPILQIQRNQATGAVMLTQDRFYNHGLSNVSKVLWHIPLTWTTENEFRFNDTFPRTWMNGKTMTINDSALGEAIFNNKWILFNINQTGLYRTNYDIENWKLLTRAYRTLPRITKIQLLDDVFAITKAGLIDTAVAWDILQHLEWESEKFLWTIAKAALTSIEHGLWDSDVFKFVMCKLLSKAYISETASLIRTEPKLWTTFKINLMKWTCSTGHKTCIRMARGLAEKILRNDSLDLISKEHRKLIYCTYVHSISEEHGSVLLERYNNFDGGDKNFIYSLGCHSNRTLLKRYLSLMFSKNDTNKDHIHAILMSVASNPNGIDIARKYFLEEWNKIRENTKNVSKLHREKHRLTEILYAFSIYMDSEENVEWLKRLKGVNEGYDTIIDDVINTVEINIAWNKNHKEKTLRILRKIFEKHSETRDCIKNVNTEAH